MRQTLLGALGIGERAVLELNTPPLLTVPTPETFDHVNAG